MVLSVLLITHHPTLIITVYICFTKSIFHESNFINRHMAAGIIELIKRCVLEGRKRVRWREIEETTVSCRYVADVCTQHMLLLWETAMWCCYQTSMLFMMVDESFSFYFHFTPEAPKNSYSLEMFITSAATSKPQQQQQRTSDTIFAQADNCLICQRLNIINAICIFTNYSWRRAMFPLRWFFFLLSF